MMILIMLKWCKPFVINNQWVCRLQYKEDVNGNFINEDLLFYFNNGEIEMCEIIITK